VINGFSELMAQIFGDDAGVGSRSAVGMGSLPGDIPVEIECMFEVA
jgi:enamine deaminase RidA (YjgF/YER057c/UK114 family)